MCCVTGTNKDVTKSRILRVLGWGGGVRERLRPDVSDTGEDACLSVD